MKNIPKIKWLSAPAKSDFTSAETFLQLLYKPKNCRHLAKKLKRAKMSKFAAKDILRASATPISEVQAFDWVKQKKEIAQHKPLSPILIVRQKNGQPLLIVDGFHRLCALFAADQEVNVRCKIV
ncbi:hypothetical protein [Glaciimonas immobilis]|uniref:ParB/Sulfiredoxin domain-containing protein n=1 Tax=Glaciimonas immobilis TaxID=728004 RepID=A0A840RX06_9BURK|nr:hypothetical protein [Glaciimonas immobilis]KAF3996126.1 hypothetical protein HAV38_20505 [Glaciimonas immobilis]MBB5201722.1 hypothetical protein [Glaciimonas immobilis]